MINVGKGAKRKIETLALSLHASYLIGQNGDASKFVIAAGQFDFAFQTRWKEFALKHTHKKLAAIVPAFSHTSDT